MTPKRMRELAARIERVVGHLEDTHRDAGRLLRVSVQSATEAERLHRRVGGGRYAASVGVTALLFAGRAFFRPKQPHTIADLASYREDARNAFMARAVVGEELFNACVNVLYRPDDTNVARDLADWDYARDVCGVS